MDKYGLIGFPLKHSFSPLIHNKAFKYLNIDAHYEKYEVSDQKFEHSILQLKESDIKGFNVTVPYKQKIIPYIDELEPLAKKVGAINTIKKSGNRWIGYNTDLYGLLIPLENHLKLISSVLIIGAGGAGNAACFALLNKKEIRKIDIVNRSKENAINLSHSLKKEFTFEGEVYDSKEIIKNRNKYDLIINTTSVGMGDLIKESPINITSVAHKKTIVYDLIYNPKETLLLKTAIKQNLRVINGLKMLIGQAKKSFEIWTGQEYPANIISEDFFYKK